MKDWVRVWRRGVAPLLSTKSLLDLRDAVAGDSPRLIQGVTTCPPPLAACGEHPVEAACAIGFCGMADGLQSVDEVSEFFRRMCAEADRRLGGAESGFFVGMWDETPRAAMLAAFLPEVELAIETRKAGAA